MPDENQPATESLGWRAGLPDDLKEHETFKSFKTVGDFAKSHLETASKVKEFEGKLANSIPKLKDNATPEEREQFYSSLGRPAKPEEYELDGDTKNATEWQTNWKNEFHRLGFSKDQAKGLSASFNGQIQKMVDAHNANIQAMNAEAETKLRAEWGDKYPANTELVNRLWKRDTDTELSQAFAGENSANRVAIMRYIYKMAAKTGEDMSSPGAHGRMKPPTSGGMIAYDKSPEPPRRM